MMDVLELSERYGVDARRQFCEGLCGLGAGFAK